MRYNEDVFLLSSLKLIYIVCQAHDGCQKYMNREKMYVQCTTKLTRQK